MISACADPLYFILAIPVIMDRKLESDPPTPVTELPALSYSPLIYRYHAASPVPAVIPHEINYPN